MKKEPEKENKEPEKEKKEPEKGNKEPEKENKEPEKVDIDETINNYKTFIYSLANFNETSLYIIQNNSNLVEKIRWDDETPLSIYMAYLKTISFLEEYNITEKIEAKLNSLKNNIDLSKIIPEIIKVYEKLDMNNNAFIVEVEKWINNYILSKNEIMEEYNKIFKEKMNIISFFKFLEINCNIIISALEAFNSIYEILNYANIYKTYLSYTYDDIKLNLNIDFIFNQDKNESRKILGDSLFKLGKDLVNHCVGYKKERKIRDEHPKLGLFKESIIIYNLIFESNMKICFYFDEETEKFYETCSNIYLIEFLKMKYVSFKKFIYNILLKSTFEEIYVDDLLLINNKLKEKDIYSLLICNSLGFNFEIKDEIQKQNILNLFNPFLEENQNLISSYLQETSIDCFEPNYENCVKLIQSKINKIFFNFLEPCLSMNYFIEERIKNEKSITKSQTSISIKEFNELRFGLRRRRRFKIVRKKELDKEKTSNKIIYNIYIDLNDIISSITNTKYHSNEELNFIFQKSAINYIINENSYFSLFIYELFYLYNRVYIEKTGEVNFLEKIKSGEIFTVKVKEGKKYTKDDFNTLKRKLEQMVKKIEKEKIQKEMGNKPAINELKHGKKVQYKLCKFDTDIKYDNIYFPFKSIYRLNGKEIKPQEFIEKYRKNRTFHKYKNTISNFINVYNLIFTVKNVDNNNIITLEKNDISEILKPYSEKEIFYSLLNQNFSYKSQDEENIDITPIKEFLKNKKLIE